VAIADLVEDFVLEVVEDLNGSFDDLLLEADGLFVVIDREGFTKLPEVEQVCPRLPGSVAFSKE
jgi:hypothetical protein